MAGPDNRTKLAGILAEAAASGPFQRLLASPGPVRAAQAAGPGHPFLAAVLAHVLQAPVLALTHDPRSADAFASGAAAFLGQERVVRFPAWESLPYEGISPSPQIAASRRPVETCAAATRSGYGR